MKFGNAAWGFRETPLEEQFKITSEMGLFELELGIANAPNDLSEYADSGELEEIKKLSVKYGVNITCAATGNDFTVGSGDIGKIKRVIDICADLGVKYLRIFAGFTPLDNINAGIFDGMIASLEEVCVYAEKKSVTPVIETHGGVNAFSDGVEHIMSATTDIDTLIKIIALLPGNARICFDPANLYAVGINDPERFYLELSDRIAYAHFKDFKKLPSGHLKPSYCGDSDMNWKAILDAMKDFRGICMFEYENIEDVREGLQKSYDYIKGLGDF